MHDARQSPAAAAAVVAVLVRHIPLLPAGPRFSLQIHRSRVQAHLPRCCRVWVFFSWNLFDSIYWFYLIIHSSSDFLEPKSRNRVTILFKHIHSVKFPDSFPCLQWNSSSSFNMISFSWSSGEVHVTSICHKPQSGCVKVSFLLTDVLGSYEVHSCDYCNLVLIKQKD